LELLTSSLSLFISVSIRPLLLSGCLLKNIFPRQVAGLPAGTCVQPSSKLSSPQALAKDWIDNFPSSNSIKKSVDGLIQE